MARKMTQTTFTCIECQQPAPETFRMFEGKDWCTQCFDTESRRSQAQDALPGGLRTRPPKYMLRPEQYKQFGY